MLMKIRAGAASDEIVLRSEDEGTQLAIEDALEGAERGSVSVRFSAALIIRGIGAAYSKGELYRKSQSS